MTTYELTVILPVAKEKAVFDKIKKLLDTAGAKITKTDEWGKRKLAYPIKKQLEAVYYLLTVDMDTEKTQAVNRILENDDDILRHMIVVAAKNGTKKMEQRAKVEKKEKVAEKPTKLVSSKGRQASGLKSKAESSKSRTSSASRTGKGK